MGEAMTIGETSTMVGEVLTAGLTQSTVKGEDATTMGDQGGGVKGLEGAAAGVSLTDDRV